MTLEQIAMMAAAAKTLKEGGAYNADLGPGEQVRVHVPDEVLTPFLTASGRQPVVEEFNKGLYWSATVTHAGVTFYALYGGWDLPQIGYHLVDGHPVPIAEEVR